MKTRSRLSILLSAALMVGTLLFTACSSTAPSPSGTTAASNKPYGSMVIAGNFGANANFDPAMSTPSTFYAIGAPIFDSLVMLTPEGQMRPGIAERWEISKDGLTHTFYIRKGVKFHDGTDLTGADVKYSVERMLAKEATHYDSAVWRTQITRVDMKDDYTVALNMKLPQFELLTGFANLGGSPTVVSKKYIEEKGVDYFRKNPMGSGPWKLTKVEFGNRFELEANENYWGEVPKFKNITVLNVTEEASKVAMLKTGELDIADITPGSAKDLKAAGLNILAHDGALQHYAFLFYDLDNPQKYPLGDVRVRKALSLAINRKEMADKIMLGYAEPSALMYGRPTGFFWDPNVLKPDPYDVQQAKKLLAEAGYPNGFDMKFYDVSGKELNQATVGYWKAIGVTASMAPVEPAIMTGMFVPKHKPELWPSAAGYLGGGGVFHFEKMQVVYHSTKGAMKNLRIPRLDEIIDKVPLTADPVEKKKLALEGAVLAMNEHSTLAILDTQTVYALNSKVGGVKMIKGIYNLPPVFETITHGK